jgi:hypothetical protein
VRAYVAAAALEREGRERERATPELAIALYLEASRRFEALARERPGVAQLYWRSARSLWLAGEKLPLDDKPLRIERFERARELASRGLEVDADCAECMLWKFASMGRLGTTRGTWTALRQTPEMAQLLDRGIALEPRYADGENNSTLGNLHYSSAIFYRILPDWFFMNWLAGVRGDKERALGHARAALALHPSRLDYRIELGSQLLCLGAVREDAARLAEGTRALREALAVPAHTQSDERDQLAARIMLETPAKACGYSGDSWIEVDEAEVMRARE